ncbi:PA2169 family four-helix-bundle protein [Flavobacterium ardleyense]|uniref:PA2169 family four-helix-bundle protein n=1 Tax=Flavobacterium ardleyense TaxID=2038737 RepID=UPI00298CB526|nr:PA2169 family four-helix-bundle protein [Flavobacterium ardleyense]
MDNSNSIDKLNKLVEINNDRVEGYETAAKEMDNGELHSLFGKLAATSHNNLSELRAEVNRLGGEPTEGTKISGKFFRAWMDVKAALSSDERQTVLDSCEFGEDKALEVYEEVLEDTKDLTSEQVAMISKQKSALKQDHDHVKVLRDANNG